MARIRQFAIGYVLALVCAGPTPLWLHHLLAHSCTTVSGAATTSAGATCAECGFCKRHAETEANEADSARAAAFELASAASNCEDCHLCFQFSQAAEKAAIAECHGGSQLVVSFCPLEQATLACQPNRILGPRGPPTADEC